MKPSQEITEHYIMCQNSEGEPNLQRVASNNPYLENT